MEVIPLGRWDNSTRRRRLPGNWSSLRQQVLRRDGFQCTWVDHIQGKRVRCIAKATDVDHIRAGDDHSVENLQSLCHPHHDRKTRGEGVAARKRNRAEVRKRFRRTEEKPVTEFTGMVYDKWAA